MNGWAVALGVISLAILIALPRRAPSFPAGLVVLAGGIGVSALLGLDSHGVDTVGNIPAGLPTLLPHLQGGAWYELLPGAAGIVLVVYSEALGAAETFATKHRYDLDGNHELVALGAGEFLAIPAHSAASRSVAACRSQPSTTAPARSRSCRHSSPPVWSSSRCSSISRRLLLPRHHRRGLSLQVDVRLAAHVDANCFDRAAREPPRARPGIVRGDARA